jgi:YidC/Oxa1 family membrane protein insertase
MPQTQESRSLRSILKEAGKGKTAEQSEVNAAVGRSTMFLVPGMVFIFAIRLALALPLYWLTSSVVAYIQQARVLRDSASEADASVEKAVDKPAKAIAAPAGLKVTRKTLSGETKTKKSPNQNKNSSRSKRRRR